MPGTRCHCHHRRWSSFQLCLCHCCLASPDAIRCSKRYFCRFKMLGLTRENTCKHWWILPRWEHNLEPLNKSLRILPLVRRTSWLGCERSSQVTLHSRLLVCHRSWFGLVKVLREGHCWLWICNVSIEQQMLFVAIQLLKPSIHQMWIASFRSVILDLVWICNL